jgi:hypothetical protein
VTRLVVLVKNALLHHTATKHFKPLAVEEDLKLKGGFCFGDRKTVRHNYLFGEV